jgi:hypothetical protein
LASKWNETSNNKKSGSPSCLVGSASCTTWQRENKHTPGLYAVLHEWLASKLSPDSIQALHRQSQQIPFPRLCCTFQVGRFDQTLIAAAARSGVCHKWEGISRGICPLQPRRRHIPRRLARRYGGGAGLLLCDLAYLVWLRFLWFSRNFHSSLLIIRFWAFYSFLLKI